MDMKKHPVLKPSVILITGASSGLGAALALLYAERGVKLLLVGRHAQRLSDIEQRCRNQGAAVKTAAIDLRDTASIEKQINGWDDQEAIDLVIANAGISGGDSTPFADIVATNIDGVFNTVNPLITRMRDRKRGQIAIVSSIAGVRGLPNAVAYSTSKVAVRAYGEALRPLLARDNIGVTVIMPGFIRTPLTSVNKFRMPFLMQPEKAAEIIHDGLARNKARIAFPFVMYWFVRFLAALPQSWSDAILSRGPKKA